MKHYIDWAELLSRRTEIELASSEEGTKLVCVVDLILGTILYRVENAKTCRWTPNLKSAATYYNDLEEINDENCSK